jgi:hypothetical protein
MYNPTSKHICTNILSTRHTCISPYIVHRHSQERLSVEKEGKHSLPLPNFPERKKIVTVRNVIGLSKTYGKKSKQTM